jgi:hypothetical protein
MKLCTYEVVTPVGRLRRTGIVTDTGIVDACAVRTAFLERSLPARAAARIGAAQAPIDMIALIGSGPLAVEWLGEALQVVLPSGTEQTSDGQRILCMRATPCACSRQCRGQRASPTSASGQHIRPMPHHVV